MERTQIGWFNLKEEHEYTNTYECAAWYENVLVPPGRYPIEVYDFKVLHFDDEARASHNGRVDCYIGMGYISMDGIITSDEFGARLFGVPVGDYDNYKNAGKKSSHTRHIYLYDIADSILDDPDSPYELLPGFKAERRTYGSEGEQFTFGDIFAA